ncbi:MAG: aspartate/glutamate racemase family protein [Bosea sp.]|uniref:aspartate/glutamate racemase family protein n=1 Tax=unclassified Bosea (in: a-proteobacteria) TaxID=2653178 RepID=UPI00095D3D86|nr:MULTISPECIES: aspartate/glutamate racemase family protein [unclassified Bosea (in: a-proteobacteria)]MBN9455778.1 aspartate/glutamate racemase family protein [Bosea sp. (in: a-proteobacteria)]OJV06037.1 MAG: Asp/Glu racemase [Bosea sp. 67-29]
MSGTIYVINPNSTERVTREIEAAIAPLRMAGGPPITCLTLAEGPPGIQSQRDADGLIPALLRRAAGLEDGAAAFVVACFSDPGMHALREQSERPVLGIAEAGVLTALTLGPRFGIIAMLQNSIPRHLRYLGAMGVMGRFAGDLPVNLTIAEMADDALTLGRMVAVGRSLRDTHHADVLVMGCAGMARFREPLERELGIPVVEPTQAAVTMAIGRVQLGWGGRPLRKD